MDNNDIEEELKDHIVSCVALFNCTSVTLQERYNTVKSLKDKRKLALIANDLIVNCLLLEKDYHYLNVYTLSKYCESVKTVSTVLRNCIYDITNNLEDYINTQDV